MFYFGRLFCHPATVSALPVTPVDSVIRFRWLRLVIAFTGRTWAFGLRL